MGEGVEVRCPARGVEAEQGVSRHGHVQIPLERYPVQIPHGHGFSLRVLVRVKPLSRKKKKMGDPPPDMAPRRTSQALLRREDVREGASILAREPLPAPDGFWWGPRGKAFPDGDAMGRGAVEVQPIGVGAVAFSPRPSTWWSREVCGWLTPDPSKMPLLTSPESLQGVNARAPVVLLDGGAERAVSAMR